MPGKVTDARTLFAHQLGEMLYVERTLADEVLPKLVNEVQNAELRDGLEQHLRQTKDQASKVEKAFEMLGDKPEPQPSHALDGLKKTHDQLAKNIEHDALRDLFDAGAAAKTEHLEIAGYTALVTMAEQMGESDVAKVLNEICRQEEQTLHRLEQVTEKLSKELAPA